jgi:hypothetical protein
MRPLTAYYSVHIRFLTSDGLVSLTRINSLIDTVKCSLPFVFTFVSSHLPMASPHPRVVSEFEQGLSGLSLSDIKSLDPCLPLRQ